MAPSLEMHSLEIDDDGITLAFKISDDEWKDIKGYVVNDIKLSTPYDDFTIQEDFYKKMIKGDFDMENKVLNLWYKKEYNKIVDKYEKKEKDYFNSIEIVKQYKELVENFETEMKALYESVDNQMTQYIEEKCTGNMYQYGLNTIQLNGESMHKFISERTKELDKLEDLKNEIEAQLSLSNDLEYQLEVLTRYGIIDKKTKKMVD